MYKPPIRIVERWSNSIYKKLEDELMVAVTKAVGFDINEDELLSALRFDRGQYEEGYVDGRWDTFKQITDVWYGKSCYGMDTDGRVYSRVIHGYHPSLDDAINEFLDEIDGGI